MVVLRVAPTLAFVIALVGLAMPVPGIAEVGEAQTSDPFQGVPPPEWELGMTWTYQVGGDHYQETDYTARFGVIAETADRFLVGTDSDTELKNSVLARHGLMAGEIHKNRFGIILGHAVQDLVGFIISPGYQWNVTLWGQDFTMQLDQITTVTHAAGSSLGRVTTGVSDSGDTLRVAYANDARWITAFEWRDDSGDLRLSYTLVDLEEQGDTSGMRVWEMDDISIVRAIGILGPVGAQRWSASGVSSLVFLRAETEGDARSLVAVSMPSGQLHSFQHNGAAVEDRVVRYEAGDWYTSIVSDRGVLDGHQVTLWIVQVTERTA